jgi:hypothetical protein
MPALGREWGSLDATQLSQVLFVLAKWRAPPPPDRLRAAAARLEREAGALDGPGVCSFASALAWCVERVFGSRAQLRTTVSGRTKRDGRAHTPFPPVAA